MSQGHHDIASVHEPMLTILGVPYRDELVAQAPMPFDAFSATPYCTPFELVPRTCDQPCNPAGTRAASEAEGRDFSEPDEQAGLARGVWRIMHDRSYDRSRRLLSLLHPQHRRADSSRA